LIIFSLIPEIDFVSDSEHNVVMPIMGGREIVTRLRAIRPDIKVVFTSGYASDPETAQHARDLAPASFRTLLCRPRFDASSARPSTRLCRPRKRAQSREPERERGGFSLTRAV
jgi:hypothetical protein